jgi:hypothetical protein
MGKVGIADCVRYKCNEPRAGARPWCDDHEPLDLEEQRVYVERTVLRAEAVALHGAGVRRKCTDCAEYAEPDRMICAEHIPRCCKPVGKKSAPRRCSYSAQLGSIFCKRHTKGADEMDITMLADPGPCLECGYRTYTANAFCHVCRSGARADTPLSIPLELDLTRSDFTSAQLGGCES